MAELPRLVERTLNGVISAIEESERKHLLAQVKAIRKVAGTTGDDDQFAKLLEAFEAGWTPDYYIGASLQIAAQLTMTTARSRQLDATGKVSFGPLSIEGGYTEEFTQGTTTNLSVNLVMERRSRSQGLENAFSALFPTPEPVVTPSPSA